MTAREELRQEIKTEARQFMVQAILAFAAVFGVGVAIGRFWP